MRFILKSLLLLVLSLFLLAGLGVLTFPLWGPAAFKQGAGKVLREVGFTEADVALEAVGLSQLSLTLEHLRYQGVTVSDAGLQLGYDFPGLRRSELEQVTLAHPGVAIDLSHDWPAAENTGNGSAPSLMDQLPARFPVKNLSINDAVITLRDSDWARTFELDAQLTGQEAIEAEVSLLGEGVQMDAQADVLWAERSGRVSATARVDDLDEWIKLGQNRGWFSVPEGFSFTVEPLKIEAGAGFAEQALRDWNLELTTQGLAASMAPAEVSVAQVALKAQGEGAQPGPLELKLSDGTAIHQDLNLSFAQLLASSSDSEQFDFRLTGWELSGETDIGGLGAVSASAGDVALTVDGAWQAWRPDFEMTNLGWQLRVAQAPLSLFTALGSAAGSWQMDANISPSEGGELSILSLSTQLLAGSLTAAAASFESERLSVSIHGSLPNSLGGVVGVQNGGVTWSDGGGHLTGLAGEFELASLLPLVSNGRQTLQFDAIKQGEFTTGPGELHLNYASEREQGPPLELEITTTALGGKVRILVAGQLSAPLALSVRVFLDSVELEEIVALFPQFEGRIEGVASGELALRLAGTKIVLQPGELQLVADTIGRFEYLRQGWLTQKPNLNPETFVSGRDILEIIQDSQGAQVLTEMAMRNLKMSEFSLKIRESATGQQSVVAEIKGERSIKGVTVPVVLKVPIRGDVKETINAVFEFNARM